MSQNPTVPLSSLEKDGKDSLQCISIRLSEALRAYKSTLDVTALKSVYSQHLSNQKLLEINKINTTHSLLKAFSTFNLYPTGSYNNYLSILKNRSSYKAVESDWRMVGESLSSAYIKNLIENEKHHER